MKRTATTRSHAKLWHASSIAQMFFFILRCRSDVKWSICREPAIRRRNVCDAEKCTNLWSIIEVEQICFYKAITNYALDEQHHA